MLKSHMNAVENSLVSISKIPANSGHTLHKGTPREAFIKEFLENHLSANVAIDQSVNAAHNSKLLNPNINRSFTTGWIPPKVLNYVVAYTGPAQMATVHGWILNSHRNLNIPLPSWTQQNKAEISGTALDGVFLLNKGFVILDNTPLIFNNQQNPVNGIHTISDCNNGSLLMLFLLLQQACDNIDGAWLNAIPYLSNASFQNVRIV